MYRQRNIRLGLAALTTLVMTGIAFVWNPSWVKAAATVPPTINNVVYVANAAELEYIDNLSHQTPYLSATIDLTADINLSGFNWQPLSWFTGTFNGNGYTINNLSINDSFDSNVGFIGVLDRGTVENLGLVNPTVSGTRVNNEGAMVGDGMQGALTNVYVQGGSVTAQGFFGSGNSLGGLIGLEDGTTITDTYSTATVSVGSGVPTIGQVIGGFIGEQIGTVTGVWDASTATTAANGAVGSGLGAGIQSVSTTQMQTLSQQSTVYSGWNFSTVWSQANGQFPVLQTVSSPLPSLTANVGIGTIVDSTAITATANTSGDTFVSQVTSTAPAPVALGSTPPNGTSAYTSGNNIANVRVGDVVTLYEVNSGGAVDASTSVTLTTSDILGATVTYDVNGASGTAPTDSNQYMVGASPRVAGQGSLAKTGYTFSGWNTKPDGSGTSYASGSTLTIGTSNVTLYAKWTANNYSLSYNGNGNTSGGVPSGSNPAYNTTITVPGNSGNLAKTGYTFAGWNTKADGSGTSYASGAPLTMPASGVTLYAQWLPNPAGLGHRNVTQTSWTETWTAVSGASSYDVYLNNEPVGTVTQAIYDFTGEQPGTTYQVQVSSVDGSGQASVLSVPDSVTTTVYGPTSPTIITEFFPEPAQVGQAYSAQVREIGGVAPMKWTIMSGALPPGLTLSNQGVISGTPTSAGNYTFTVKVTDVNSLSSSKQLTLTVNSTVSTGHDGSSNSGGQSTPATPVSVTANNEQAATMGQPYHQTLQATGGQAPYTWSIVGETLPAGLSLNPKTGVISGTPSHTGVYNVAVQVVGAEGKASNMTITIDLLKSNQREVLWNGTVKNVPDIVQQEGTTPTTYMPIWYVMQLLKPMGITSTWDGTTWNMTTASTPMLANIQASSGKTGIYLNGTLVQNVTTVDARDPSTGKATTYMPIWYVMQLLNRVGLHSTWNGTTWTVTK